MRRMYSKKQLEEIAKDYIHEHEDVIANPQVTGTEPLLETIEIDGEKYILPENAEVTASEIDSEEATSGQVLMADGEGGASWGSVSSGTEVEANVTIPVGTVPSDLLNLKVGSNYFNNNKPIHFIKLTSTTLTSELRNEILSDDYFVVLEYNGMYYYERNLTGGVKTFYNFITRSGIASGDDNYNKKYKLTYNSFSINDTSTTISVSTNDNLIIDTSQRNIPYSYINSKTDSSTNASSGKVLTADGSGGTSWESVPSELPASLGTAGQVLQVNSGGTGVEWATPSGGGGGGTTIYMHRLTATVVDGASDKVLAMAFLSTDNTPITLANIETILSTNNTLKFLLVFWSYDSNSKLAINPIIYLNGYLRVGEYDHTSGNIEYNQFSIASLNDIVGPF